MEEKKKGISGFIIFLLIVIIIGLVGYIWYGTEKEENENSGRTNLALLVEDDVVFDDFDSKMLVLKVKNTSDKAYINVSPVIIYFDENGLPIHEAWASRIGYFAPGDVRCIEFYDSIEEYATLEIGLLDREDEYDFEDLRDEITFEVEEAEEPDEYDEIKLNFSGENKSDKDISLTFQIEYYDEEKLIYEDEFLTAVDANSTFVDYEYLATEYEDGTAFPENYTYKVNLVEAVEFMVVSDEKDSEDVVENTSAKILDYESLTDEEKIEHALFAKLTEIYGDKYDNAKIVVDKMYYTKDVKSHPELESLELGDDDIAFEVTMDIMPAEGEKPMQFMIPNGEYDEESGYVHNVYRLGVLRKVADNDYKITDYGTGW